MGDIAVGDVAVCNIAVGDVAVGDVAVGDVAVSVCFCGDEFALVDAVNGAIALGAVDVITVLLQAAKCQFFLSVRIQKNHGFLPEVSLRVLDFTIPVVCSSCIYLCVCFNLLFFLLVNCFLKAGWASKK